MASRSQTHRTTALPYRYSADGLDFVLEEYSVDGSAPEEFELKPGQSNVDLAPGSPGDPASPEESWNWVRVYGRLTVSDELVDHLFPPGERDEPPAELYVALRCHETIYRDSVSVEDAPIAPGDYGVKIRLDWSDFRGHVELRPYLVRTTNRDGADDRYASARNEKVATGQRYEVLVDHRDSEEPSMIDGEEASFSRTRHLPDGEELYYLDFRNEGRLKLWINSDYPRIADVLRSEGSVGAQPRMRDVILDQISYGVWTQLILRSAAAIEPDGSVEYEWQRTVLEAFGPAIYEETDQEEAKLRLFDDVREPEDVPRLMERIDSVLQQYLEPREQLVNLMEEGLRI